MERICKSCHSSKLVICQRDGDIVCTGCGLVQEGHLIDDTVYGNTKYEDNENCSYYRKPEQVQYTTNRGFKTLFGQASIYILGDEFDTVVVDACLLCEPVAKLHKGEHRNALYCVCFLLACKRKNIGVEARNVYAYFNVPMWSHYGKLSLEVNKHVSKNAKPKASDSDILLKRMVHNYLNLDKDSAWKVIQVACKIQQQVSCLASKVKTCKINACLVYISCKINKVESISMKQISQLYGVSVQTLQRHELLIQSVLSHGK
jgi:transcription initiation factor TFIIIB Brf1 subunit/transcription initiation factor TFIIB